MRIPDTQKLYTDLAAITGNRVRCLQCGTTLTVDAGECFRTGWPLCCGQTMHLESKKDPEAPR